MPSSDSPKAKIGVRRIYSSAFKERGRDDVVKWDVLSIVDGEEVTLRFESIDSTWRQGVWLRTDNGLLVNGIRARSVTLWFDTAPKNVPVTCFTSEGFLSIYNVWHSGRNPAADQESLCYSSGMLVEELTDGRRYRCNDIGFTTQFQKLVFSIHRASRSSV